MNLVPLKDRVIVDIIDAYHGKIILPRQEKPTLGTVIAVGKGRILEDGSRKEIELEIGDKILYGKYSGTIFECDGKKYYSIKEDEIIGKFTDQATAENSWLVASYEQGFRDGQAQLKGDHK